MAEGFTFMDGSGFDSGGNYYAPTGQTGLQAPTTLAADMPQPNSPQMATASISTDQLQPTTALKIETPTPNTTTANSSVAGATEAQKSLQSYIDQFTAPETAEQKQVGSLTKDIQDLLGQTKGQTAALGEEENKLGLPDMQKQLAQFNADILSQTAEYEVAKQEYEKLLTNEEGKVQTMGSIRGSQAQIARSRASELNLKASEIALTQARALGMQGNIQAAQAAAKRAVDLRYAPVLEELDIKSKQLQVLQQSGILDKQERIQAAAIEARYRDQQAAIAEEKAKSKTNLDLALSMGITSQFANRNGEFFNVRTGKTYGTPEEFFADAGVSSFQEAYQKGLVSDINNAQIQEKAKVGELMSKYWDAGITMADSWETAMTKLNSSKIYQKDVRIPDSGTTPTTYDDEVSQYADKVFSGELGLTSVPIKIRADVSKEVDTLRLGRYDTEFEARVDYDRELQNLQNAVTAGEFSGRPSDLITDLVKQYGTKISQQEIESTVYNILGIKR